MTHSIDLIPDATTATDTTRIELAERPKEKNITCRPRWLDLNREVSCPVLYEDEQPDFQH